MSVEKDANFRWAICFLLCVDSCCSLALHTQHFIHNSLLHVKSPGSLINKTNVTWTMKDFFIFLFSLDLQDLGSFIFSEGEMRAALLLFQHMYLWLAIAVHIKKQQEADDCVWCRKSSSTHEVLWFNEAQVPPARSFLGKHPRMWKIGHMYREHVTTPATKSYIQIMFFFSITNPMPFAMCLCHFV